MSMRLITTILLITFLTSCGFALRTAEQSRLPFSSLQLNLQQENAPFSRLLRSALESSGVSLGETGYILSIGEELHSSRPISVTNRASAAEYELVSTVQVALSDPAGIPLLGPETLAVERTYYEDIANIAGSGSEVELLRAEMRQELVDQLLRSLQSLPAPSSMPAPGR